MEARKTARRKFLLFAAISVVLPAIVLFAQNPVNWTNKELLEPADLAATIGSGKDLPVIYSIGPGAVIPHSVNIGMTRDAENLAKLKTALSKLAKNKKIVVYCGCCPFEHCPNVRPAISLMKEMHFTNYFLLNIPNNIKKDWTDKGYPVNP